MGYEEEVYKLTTLVAGGKITESVSHIELNIRKEDVNLVNDQGNTLMLWVVSYICSPQNMDKQRRLQCRPVLRALLKKGADPCFISTISRGKHTEESSALSIALLNNCRDVVGILLSTVNSSSYPLLLLHFLERAMHTNLSAEQLISLVKLLLNKDINWLYVVANESGSGSSRAVKTYQFAKLRSPFHVVAAAGRWQVLELLLNVPRSAPKTQTDTDDRRSPAAHRAAITNALLSRSELDVTAKSKASDEDGNCLNALQSCEYHFMIRSVQILECYSDRSVSTEEEERAALSTDPSGVKVFDNFMDNVLMNWYNKETEEDGEPRMKGSKLVAYDSDRSSCSDSDGDSSGSSSVSDDDESTDTPRKGRRGDKRNSDTDTDTDSPENPRRRSSWDDDSSIDEDSAYSVDSDVFASYYLENRELMEAKTASFRNMSAFESAAFVQRNKELSKVKKALEGIRDNLVKCLVILVRFLGLENCVGLSSYGDNVPDDYDRVHMLEKKQQHLQYSHCVCAVVVAMGGLGKVVNALSVGYEIVSGCDADEGVEQGPLFQQAGMGAGSAYTHTAGFRVDCMPGATARVGAMRVIINSVAHAHRLLGVMHKIAALNIMHSGENKARTYYELVGTEWSALWGVNAGRCCVDSTMPVPGMGAVGRRGHNARPTTACENMNSRSVQFLLHTLLSLHGKNYTPMGDIHEWGFIMQELAESSVALPIASAVDADVTPDTPAESVASLDQVLASLPVAALILNRYCELGTMLLYGRLEVPRDDEGDSEIEGLDDPKSVASVFQVVQEFFLRVFIARVGPIAANVKAFHARNNTRKHHPRPLYPGESALPQTQGKRLSALQESALCLCPDMFDLWRGADKLVTMVTSPCRVEITTDRVAVLVQGMYLWALVDQCTGARHKVPSGSVSANAQRAMAELLRCVTNVDASSKDTLLSDTQCEHLNQFAQREASHIAYSDGTPLAPERARKSPGACPENKFAFQKACSGDESFAAALAATSMKKQLTLHLVLTAMKIINCQFSYNHGEDENNPFSHYTMELLRSASFAKAREVNTHYASCDYKSVVSLSGVYCGPEYKHNVKPLVPATVGCSITEYLTSHAAIVAPDWFCHWVDSRQAKLACFMSATISETTYRYLDIELQFLMHTCAKAAVVAAGARDACSFRDADEALEGMFLRSEPNRAPANTLVSRKRCPLRPTPTHVYQYINVIPEHVLVDYVRELCNIGFGCTGAYDEGSDDDDDSDGDDCSEESSELGDGCGYYDDDCTCGDNGGSESSLSATGGGNGAKGSSRANLFGGGSDVPKGSHGEESTTVSDATSLDTADFAFDDEDYLVTLDRLSSPEDMFNSVISQLCVLMHRDNVVSTGFHYLSQREFAVAYKGEPGSGPGPLKEFFEIMIPLMFSISPLTTAEGANQDPSGPKAHRVNYAACLPLFQPGNSSYPEHVVPRPVEDIERDALGRHPNWCKKHVNAIENGGTELSWRFGQEAVSRLMQCVGLVIGFAIKQAESVGLNLALPIWDYLLNSHHNMLYRSVDESKLEELLRYQSEANAIPMAVHEQHWRRLCGVDSTLLSSCLSLIKMADRNVMGVPSEPIAKGASKSRRNRKAKGKKADTEPPGRSDAVAEEKLASHEDPIAALGLTFAGVQSVYGPTTRSPVVASAPNKKLKASSKALTRDYKLADREVELVRGGSNATVTSGNVLSYVSAKLSMYSLGFCATSASLASESMSCIRSGLRRVIPAHLAACLSPVYVAQLLQGCRRVHLPLLKQHMLYEKPYHENHPVIMQFWHLLETEYCNIPSDTNTGDSLGSSSSSGVSISVTESLENEAKLRKLLLFWTGSTALPSCGFFGTNFCLDPDPLTIAMFEYSMTPNHPHNSRNSNAGGSSDMVAGSTSEASSTHKSNTGKPLCLLPTVSTCMKLLRLPREYSDLAILRMGMQNALDYGAVGFDQA